MTKHKHRPKSRYSLTVKIPESVEKSADEKLRQGIVDETANELLIALNKMINKHDLTFEEALYALDIIELSVLSKYVNVRIDMRLDEIVKFKDREGRMYA